MAEVAPSTVITKDIPRDLNGLKDIPFCSCSWAECTDGMYKYRLYKVEKGGRTAKKIVDKGYCTVVGNAQIPPNAVTSWNIRITKSAHGDAEKIHIGVAPYDIYRDFDKNFNLCGWYYCYYYSSLFSGPPHNYRGKKYGPKKVPELGKPTANNPIRVTMNTITGELSFSLYGVNCGVAYDGIPLDKPLVPCVHMCKENDEISFDLPEVDESVNSGVPFPANITAGEGDTCYAIYLKWDAVKDAIFYQVEIDGSKFWKVTTQDNIMIRGFYPETEHSFRVRTATKDGMVGDWSAPVVGRTSKDKDFTLCGWRPCLDYLSTSFKYSVNGDNNEIASYEDKRSTRTIPGNTPLPPDTVVTWAVNVRTGYLDYKDFACIGVAPSDIEHNSERNQKRCGWYYDVRYNALFSGPPHCYRKKKFGPNTPCGNDIIGFIMDTKTGDLSITKNGFHYGVAYEGIPLDKPLIPCAVFYAYRCEFELMFSQIGMERVDASVAVPANVTAKSTSWCSIDVKWDKSGYKELYQIEVEGKKGMGITFENSYTIHELEPAEGYNIRVRASRGDLVSEWSAPVREFTLKPYAEKLEWKPCPEYVVEKKRYVLDKENPRIAIPIGESNSVIVGSTPFPFNCVAKYGVKIVKAKSYSTISVGVVPYDVDQNSSFITSEYGWHLSTLVFSLYSGPPHKYYNKYYSGRYGILKKGEAIYAVMNTTEGKLRFIVGGNDYGLAFDKIPLDKPLLPCVIAYYEGTHVELISKDDGDNAGNNDKDCIIS